MLLIVKMRSLSVTIGMLALTLALCLVRCREIEAPARPSGVPGDAIWAGGDDGGCFVKCEVDEARNVNNCVAYLDSNGQVLQRGEYRIRGKARAATTEELAYEWCDGKAIGLKNGVILDPVEKGPRPRRAPIH